MIPKTLAGRVQMVFELMNIPVVDKDGNPVLDENGEPKTYSLITPEDARKILDYKEEK